MTRQERMEELLFNISRASDEMLTYISEARVQDIVVKDLTGPEKKSNPLEKNDDPEKKSPRYSIWMKWCDDVAAAFSTMFTDEDEFHMKNLADIISASIEAVNDLIDISFVDYPDNNKVVSVKRKEKTLRDVVKARDPESVGPNFMGYVRYCPGDYDLPHTSYCHGGPTNEKLCRECWLQPYKPHSV